LLGEGLEKPFLEGKEGKRKGAWPFPFLSRKRKRTRRWENRIFQSHRGKGEKDSTSMTCIHAVRIGGGVGELLGKERGKETFALPLHSFPGRKKKGKKKGGGPA